MLISTINDITSYAKCGKLTQLLCFQLMSCNPKILIYEKVNIINSMISFLFLSFIEKHGRNMHLHSLGNAIIVQLYSFYIQSFKSLACFGSCQRLVCVIPWWISLSQVFL